jgi:hypothetical protein
MEAISTTGTSMNLAASARGLFALRPLCLASHRLLNGAVLLLVPVQFYAAGIGIFGAGSLQAHSLLGWSMLLLAFFSLVSSIVARAGTEGVLQASALLLLIILQPILVFVPRAAFPAVSALHPLNGLAIGIIAYVIHRRLTSDRGR